jgi:hypothetical protein
MKRLSNFLRFENEFSLSPIRKFMKSLFYGGLCKAFIKSSLGRFVTHSVKHISTDGNISQLLQRPTFKLMAAKSKKQMCFILADSDLR